MTACVDNKEKKGGAAKAVSATLAGVLAVGMVPAVAFAADEAPEQEAGAELLVADDAFAKATVVAVTDNDGKTIEIEEGDEIELAFTGTSHFIKSVKLELADGSDTVIDVANGNEYSFQFADDEGNLTPNQVQEIDDYTLTIKCINKDSQYNGQTKTINFSIKAEESDPNISFEMITSAEGSVIESTDANIVFSGQGRNGLFNYENGCLALMVNGEQTKINTAQVYPTSDTSTSGLIPSSSTEPLYAGDYVAIVTYGDDNEKATVLFTVNPFDLAGATVVADAVDAAPTDEVNYTIAGPCADVQDLLKVTYDMGKNGGVPQAGIDEVGEYTFTLAPDTSKVDSEDASKLTASITGTKDFGVEYVTTIVDITYDDKGNLKDQDFGVFYIGGSETFSANDVKFTYDEGAETVDKDLCSVVVTNEAGEAVTDWATVPGKYTVVAKVSDPKHELGGSAVATFEVKYADAATNGIYVQYNGELTSKIETTYDGTNIAEGISVKVVNGDYTMVEGTDYEIVYTNSENKEVTEIVDADTYTLTVKPITFKFADKNNTVEITVKAVTPSALRVANQVTINEDVTIPYYVWDADKEEWVQVNASAGETGLAYTGAAITPVIEYTTAELVGGEVPENAKWVTLPADVYTTAYRYSKEGDATTGKYVDEILKVGNYAIELTRNADVKNYSFEKVETALVTVIDAKRFIDVPTSAWYAEYVDQAVANGYIYGYSYGKLFGPNDNIKRGDAVIVLARMAGVSLAIDENQGSETTYYETPFSDVNGNLYYAEAIAWAADAGIVTGDLGQGTFRPEDSISRQEFAVMLTRYAEKAGSDTTVDVATELAKYTDGASVADWADEAVAWLSSEGIMTGHDGTTIMDPASPVTRAQVAKMAVEYQPEAL